MAAPKFTKSETSLLEMAFHMLSVLRSQLKTAEAMLKALRPRAAGTGAGAGAGADARAGAGAGARAGARVGAGAGAGAVVDSARTPAGRAAGGATAVQQEDVEVAVVRATIKRPRPDQNGRGFSRVISYITGLC